MFILGLQGSPRKKGNTDTLLANFLEQAGAAGAATHTIQADRAGIASCRGCGYCEKHGVCVIRDDPMATEVFGLLREADMVVAASPVYFYGVSAQLKLLIDRCQTLWSRKYVYTLKDPLSATRTGVLLSVAASTGRQLFDGIHLTAKYFFDGIDARFAHTLVYRGVEARGDILTQPGVDADIAAVIAQSVRPMIARRRILFVSPNGACRAPMAAAMVQMRGGTDIRAAAAGVDAREDYSPAMVQAMQRSGVDLAYRRPAAVDAALYGLPPTMVITIGDVADEALPASPTIERWDIPLPSATTEETMDSLRRIIAEHVDRLQPWIDRSQPIA